MNIFHNKIAMKLLNKNIYFFYIEIDKNPLARKFSISFRLKLETMMITKTRFQHVFCDQFYIILIIL